MKYRIERVPCSWGTGVSVAVDDYIYLLREDCNWEDARRMASHALGETSPRLSAIVPWLMENDLLMETWVCSCGTFVKDGDVCLPCECREETTELMREGYTRRDAEVEAMLGDGPGE